MRKRTFVFWLALLVLSVCFRTEAQETRRSKPEIGKYVNAVKGLSFQYPLSWTVMSPEDVAEKTKNQFDTKDAIAFVVNERDPDKNVNIKSFPVPKDSATTTELLQLEKMLDQQFPQQFTGFKKVSAKVITVAGVKALEYVMDVSRIGKRFRQKSVLVIKGGRDFVFTFTAPREAFQQSNEVCFKVIIDTVKIR